MGVNTARWMVALLVAVVAAVRAQAQTAETFAQRLATSQAAKRAVDLAAVQATPSNKVFYVRMSGNDANTGLASNAAFLTIQRAINAVTTSGSFIVVGPGAYAETLAMTANTASGSSGSPNTIFADVTGDLTGDSAGSVTVSGTGGRQYGLTMQSCSNWSFRWLTFSGQSTGNVYILPSAYTVPASVGGLVFDGCTFDVTPYYGLVAYSVGDLTVNDCTFFRSVLSGFGLYAYTVSASNLTVTNNRCNRTGSTYDTSGFKNGTLNSGSGSTSWSGLSAISFGLIAMATGTTPTTVTVQNNTVSDAFVGVYTYAYGGSHTIRVANNTVVSSYYGMYTYGSTSISGAISNNIVGNCYVGAYTYLPQGSIAGHIEWNINYPTLYPSFVTTYQTTWRTVASTSTFVTDQVPAFVSASTGDFTLDWGSVGMDTGVATYAPTTDAAGVARPIDGNGDGTLAVDFGAVEAPLTRRLRVVRWLPVSLDD